MSEQMKQSKSNAITPGTMAVCINGKKNPKINYLRKLFIWNQKILPVLFTCSFRYIDSPNAMLLAGRSENITPLLISATKSNILAKKEDQKLEHFTENGIKSGKKSDQIQYSIDLICKAIDLANFVRILCQAIRPRCSRPFAIWICSTSFRIESIKSWKWTQTATIL